MVTAKATGAKVSKNPTLKVPGTGAQNRFTVFPFSWHRWAQSGARSGAGAVTRAHPPPVHNLIDTGTGGM